MNSDTPSTSTAAPHSAAAPAADAATVPLHRAAHGRTGDKGNRSNISLIAWHPDLYPLLVAQITEQAVAAHFAHRRPQAVRRHLLPTLGALNFVLDEVLDGGVNDALNLDTHGKALAFHLLDLPLRVPPALLPRLAGGDGAAPGAVPPLAPRPSPSRPNDDT